MIAAFALAVVSVIAPTGADQVQTFAAQELARYLARVTGQAVAVGDVKAAHRLRLGEAPAGVPLKPDGFLLRRQGPDILIQGRGSRGVLYGCYAYLERLGVRWYFPGKDYEIVPRRAIDWNAALDVAESPAIPFRILDYSTYTYGPAEEWIDFAAKSRLNRILFGSSWPARDWFAAQREQLLPQLRKRGLMIEVGGHLLPTFLPRTMFKEHPDWFRRNRDGARTPDFNFNPFHPGALEYVTEGAVKYLTSMPEASLYHLWPDDLSEGGWTHEPGKEQYTPSDQSLLVANNIVTKLREKLPAANLVYLSYHDTMPAPRVVKPVPGIIYFYAPRERCYTHAMDDPDCAANRKYAKALEDAMPVFGAANAQVFDYYVDQILYQNMASPPQPEVIAADTRYYRRLGVPRLGTLTVNSSEYVTPAVNMFLFPRAYWNPDQDLNVPLNEYAVTYFGDAGMKDYFRELKLALGGLVKMCRFERMTYSWYHPDAATESDEALSFHAENMEQALRGPLPRAQAYLEAALRRVGSPVYRRRIEREKESLDYTFLQARLYWHLVRGERAYRTCRERQERDACLVAASASVLARHYRFRLERFIGRTKLKGEPIVGDTEGMARKLRGLARRSIVNTNFLYQQLPAGVDGAVIDSGGDCLAVLYADVPGPVHAKASAEAGIEWRDEFGEPLKTSPLNVAGRPVVAYGRGIAPDALFNRILASLR